MIFFPAPPVFQQPKQAPELSIFGRIAFSKGAVIVVGENPAWKSALESELLRPRLEKIKVMYVPRAGNVTAQTLGLDGEGVYFLDRACTILKSFHSDPPVDLANELDKLGWVSEDEYLKGFIKKYPDRLDLRWDLFNMLLGRLNQSQSDLHLSQCASALEDLLGQPGWAQVPNLYREPVLPSEGLDPANPLARLAERRWNSVAEELKRSPAHGPLWQIASLLAAWHPYQPKLFRLIVEMEAPDLDRSGALEWPSPQGLDQAVQQLRRQKDWHGMTEFAENRLDLVTSREAAFNPKAGNEWSGTTTVTNDKVIQISRKEKLGAALGRWLLLELEAELGEGREGTARLTANRILQEANREDWSRALHLAEGFKAKSIVELLRQGMDR